MKELLGKTKVIVLAIAMLFLGIGLALVSYSNKPEAGSDEQLSKARKAKEKKRLDRIAEEEAEHEIEEILKENKDEIKPE